MVTVAPAALPLEDDPVARALGLEVLAEASGPPSSPTPHDDPVDSGFRRLDARLDALTEWLAAWSRWQEQSAAAAAPARLSRRVKLVLAMVAVFAPLLALLILLIR